MINLCNICLNYKSSEEGTVALKGVELHVDKGEDIAIIGKSGSGKTTLLSLLGALLKPSKGSYLFEKQDVSTYSDKMLSEFRGKSIGFIFQEFFLLPQLSVLENILLPFDHSSNRNKKEEIEYADYLLERVGLRKLRNRFPNELSGGQVQRVAIARALVRKPPLILADEPTGNLDFESSEMIMNLLMGFVDDETTLIVVTHNNYVSQKFSRKIFIENGVIV